MISLVPSAACGDGECQIIEQCEFCPENEKEKEGLHSLCVVCPEDCCPLTLFIFFVMALGILMFIVIVPTIVTILTVLLVSFLLHKSQMYIQIYPPMQCVMWRKKKRMKDESWIISYNDIAISE